MALEWPSKAAESRRARDSASESCASVVGERLDEGAAMLGKAACELPNGEVRGARSGWEGRTIGTVKGRGAGGGTASELWLPRRGVARSIGGGGGIGSGIGGGIGGGIPLAVSPGTSGSRPLAPASALVGSPYICS